jgi:hypothetical protein
MAAKAGGGDPDGNARLRLAIIKAKEGNMPADIINRAIDKAVNGTDNTNLDEIVYEGYGPGGTAVMVEAVTDNRNRTASEIRNAFGKGGGSMGESGLSAGCSRPAAYLLDPPKADAKRGSAPSTPAPVTLRSKMSRLGLYQARTGRVRKAPEAGFTSGRRRRACASTTVQPRRRKRRPCAC